MLLKNVHTTFYKSIDDSGEVLIDQDVTVLVGQNESGKTAFLQSIYKSLPVEKEVKYSKINDYPRKTLSLYDSTHKNKEAQVINLTFELNEDEIEKINSELDFKLLESLSFSLAFNYASTYSVGLNINEKEFLKDIISKSVLPSDIKIEASKCVNLNNLKTYLSTLDLNEESKSFLKDISSKFDTSKSNSWDEIPLSYYIWCFFIKPNLPKFIYFDDYKLLTGKINLNSLNQRINNNTITEEDKTFISLLKLANITIPELIDSSSYEESKAKLESISNSITDKIFEFWTQNKELQVEFDIKEDPKDLAPFNNGKNLYIRIRNLKHRVSVPFDQRSKGFIWFFSFIVWFDSIKKSEDIDSSLILLLDEPGLSLHAIAQKDFLKYIDNLADYHQIIYTTHSPFMVNNDRLHQVRVVEDTIKSGTKVSSNISSSEPKTIFPLQAALGYTIAQNLFISKKNLLVEGISDLVYLNFFSSILEKIGRVHLSENITIVPVGGLDKLATFVSLLGANQLDMVVLHDFMRGKPQQQLDSLIRQKLIKDKLVLNYSIFRNERDSKTNELFSSDVEDLIDPKLYIKLFKMTYKKELNDLIISEEDLPEGERIIERFEKYLKNKSIKLRASGGFNHYLIANYLVSNPVDAKDIDDNCINKFENLFIKINDLLKL